MMECEREGGRRRRRRGEREREREREGKGERRGESNHTMLSRYGSLECGIGTMLLPVAIFPLLHQAQINEGYVIP